MSTNIVQSAHQKVFKDSNYKDLGNFSSIWQFLKRYDKEGHVIYIASDSDAVKEAAKLKFSKRFVDILVIIAEMGMLHCDCTCTSIFSLCVIPMDTIRG